jgi:hypothetical protein
VTTGEFVAQRTRSVEHPGCTNCTRYLLIVNYQHQLMIVVTVHGLDVDPGVGHPSR